MGRTSKNKNKTTKDSKGKQGLLKRMFGGGIKVSDAMPFEIGLVVMALTIFLVVAFISHIVDGCQYQSFYESVQNGTTEQDAIPANIKPNLVGYMGYVTAKFFMDDCFGFASFFIPLFTLFLSLRLMKTYNFQLWRKFVNFGFLMIWGSAALEFFSPQFFRENFVFSPGGAHGEQICHYLSSFVGYLGVLMIIVILAICYLIYLSHRTIVILNELMQGKYFVKLKKCPIFNLGKEEKEIEELVDEHKIEVDEIENIDDENLEDNPNVLLFGNVEDLESDEETIQLDNTLEIENPPKAPEFEVSAGQKDEDVSSTLVEQQGQYDPTLDLASYKFPPLDLLKVYDNSGSNIDMEEQNENKNKIISILHNFKVEITSIKATVGPTITLYEITPAPGVKISRIRGLEDDIALALAALGVRIIAPIPGKGTIGIEVPNKKPQIVSAESIFKSRKFQESKAELPIVLGRTITNEIYMIDLAKMPHLLVAGATGMGKSVGLNIIISSLLYKKHPSEMKLVLVDPKKVEFSVYSPLDKYFIAKVDDGEDDVIITDNNKVKKTLNSLCKEMDDRYLLLKQAQTRNIKEYNEKFKNRKLNPEHGHRFLPYIVVIIDEFGDLIMTAGKEVELPIARIAQLARAVGIHMVIATQRPTVNIITGTIKANFPARIAFRVSAAVDSKTILDRPGAQQLVGKGDMLFSGTGNSPERIQCGFIDTPEVEAINQYISSQNLNPVQYFLPDVVGDGEGNEDMGDGALTRSNLDSMFEECARLIVVHQSGSTSLLQRKFSIGYNRAGKIMDQLECVGVVGPSQGSKPRDVLIRDEIELEQIVFSRIK